MEIYIFICVCVCVCLHTFLCFQHKEISPDRKIHIIPKQLHVIYLTHNHEVSSINPFPAYIKIFTPFKKYIFIFVVSLDGIYLTSLITQILYWIYFLHILISLFSTAYECVISYYYPVARNRNLYVNSWFILFGIYCMFSQQQIPAS